MTKGDLINQRININKIERYLKENQLEQLGDFIPGMLHLNRKDDLFLQYMSPNGLRLLDQPLDYVVNQPEEFFNEYVHQSTLAEVFPKFINFYNLNDDGRTYADVQLILNPQTKDFYPLLSVTKVVKGLEGLLTISLPLHNAGSQVTKIASLLYSDNFYEKNFERFQTLTSREKEILGLLASGKTNREISDILFISVATVDTHRKRIRKKLDYPTTADLIKYANSFGLI